MNLSVCKSKSFFLMILLILSLTNPRAYAAQTIPQSDLGTVTVSDINSGTQAFENMLKMGGPRLFTVNWKNDSLSTTLLSVSEDRASENLKTTNAFFRLRYFQNDQNEDFYHYVDHADSVINSMTEFNKFLASTKGKTFNHLTLKLNNYKAQKSYPYPEDMGFKGTYNVQDEAIAGNSMLRTVIRYTHRDDSSEKNYRVKNPAEFKSALKDAMQHFYYKFTIETPTFNEKTYDFPKIYVELQSEIPESEFSNSMLWSAKKLATRSTSSQKPTKYVGIYTACFDYPHSRADNQTLIRNSLSKISTIVANTINTNMSDVDKIRALHDYLLTHTLYDQVSANFDLPYRDHHLISAALLDGKAVCTGYAWAMQSLLNKIGIENYVVSGKARPTKGGSPANHAWNIVKLGNHYYHLDSTWDDQDGKDNAFHYGYFLVDDATLSNDHFWDRKSYPACTDGSLEYYRNHNLVAENYDDFQIMMTTMFSSGKTSITFRSKSFVPEWIDEQLKQKVYSYQPSWNGFHYDVTSAGSIRTITFTGK